MKFRAYHQDPWADWDPEFIREVRANARGVCVWVPGLFSHLRPPIDVDGRDCKAWEAAMRRVLPREGRPPAYAILHFERFPRRVGLGPGNPMPYTVRIGSLWTRTLGLSRRLEYMLRLLMSATTCRVCLYCEDFAARWAFDADFTADVYVFDNPMLCASEVESRPRLLSRPIYVRHCQEHHLSRWADWRMHFPRDEMIPGAAVKRLQGQWNVTDHQLIKGWRCEVTDHDGPGLPAAPGPGRPSPTAPA
jgi:hypothetical protein